MVASVSVSVKNKGPGLRVFKNVYNQDIPIQPGDSRTFDMHPHLVRMLDRDAQKKESTIELHVDGQVLAEVKAPVHCRPQDGARWQGPERRWCRWERLL
jgi:hypothetical protein